MAEDIIVRKTNPNADRTKASRVDYEKSGKKNIVMKGPLAEIITKALNEMFKFDRKTSLSQESLYLEGNGKKVIIDKNEENSTVLFAVYEDVCSLDDVIEFSLILKEAKENDEIILGLLSNPSTKTISIASAIIKELAILNELTIIDSVEKYFSSLLGRSETEFRQDDISTEALDQYKPKKRVKLKGSTASLAKEAGRRPKEFAVNALKSLNEIEQLAEKVKKTN